MSSDFLSHFSKHIIPNYFLAFAQLSPAWLSYLMSGLPSWGPFFFFITTYPTSLMSVYLFLSFPHHLPAFYHIGPRSTNSVLSGLCVRFTYF